MSASSAPSIPFVDLAAQRRPIAAEIDAAIARVLEHGRFVMGPEVEELETELARRAGVRHCLTCSSGTTALTMALLARDVGPGDAVFTPAFTFTSSAEVVALRGATPVFVDVDATTFAMDPASLEAAIATARAAGLRPTCVMPVDLFGQPADHEALRAVAEAHGLWTLGDAAQSFGARRDGRAVGSQYDVTATSFYPSKPLGCYGDGGAVFTDDDELHRRLRSVRVHGQGRTPHETERIGLTARCDTLQAAVLLVKLRVFDGEIERRGRIAARYADGLADVVAVPTLAPGAASVWAQYTIRTPHRDRVVRHLAERGIATAVYYDAPLHRQAPYARFPVVDGGLPVTEALAREVVSLPINAHLDPADQDRVVAAVREVHADANGVTGAAKAPTADVSPR